MATLVDQQVSIDGQVHNPITYRDDAYLYEHALGNATPTDEFVIDTDEGRVKMRKAKKYLQSEKLAYVSLAIIVDQNDVYTCLPARLNLRLVAASEGGEIETGSVVRLADGVTFSARIQGTLIEFKSVDADVWTNDGFTLFCVRDTASKKLCIKRLK
jgi:hypothetical protein